VKAMDEEAFLAVPENYPHLTAEQARAVDSAIDQYNDAISGSVRNARKDGLDWRIVEIAGVLDRMAVRRYILDPDVLLPDWWTPHEMPQALRDALGFTPDTRFLRSGPDGITEGGIFSLDGIHLTTTGHGIIAHECMEVMKQAGVRFLAADGSERADPQFDFARAAGCDTLLAQPPSSGLATLDLLGRLDDRFALTDGLKDALRGDGPLRPAGIGSRTGAGNDAVGADDQLGYSAFS